MTNQYTNKKKNLLYIESFFRNLWFLIRTNGVTILQFLILYFLINVIATTTLMEIFIDVAMKLNGISYIGLDNLFSFLRNPFTIILLFILALFVTLFSIFQISCIMHAHSISIIGKKASLSGTIKAGLMSCQKSLHPKNWLIFVFILVLVPLTGFYSLSFDSLSVFIPAFVSDFIMERSFYKIVYYLLYFLLLLVEISTIFAMNFYILADIDFVTAIKKSRMLIRKKYILTFVCLIIILLLFHFAITCIGFILNLKVVMKLLISPGINITALTALFFCYIEQREMLTDISKDAFHNHKLSKIATSVILVSLILLTCIFVQSNLSTSVSEDFPLSSPQIIAHRGYSGNAPENTIFAFEMALQEKVDWIELDVQLTKDGVAVVIHDDALSRISGTNRLVEEMTYDEISQLDVGSWFSSSFSDARISTLDEVLKLCKNKVMVQIEIKDNQYKENIACSVLQIANAHDMIDEICITSFSKEQLKLVKEINPSVKTAYIMPIALKHIEDIEYADYYSVEISSITKELVHNVHAAGGKIFAGPVNEENPVQYLVDCGVDGILTNHVSMLKNTLEHSEYSGGIAKVFRKYTNKLSSY